jgi:hypothetical protein
LYLDVLILWFWAIAEPAKVARRMEVILAFILTEGMCKEVPKRV